MVFPFIYRHVDKATGHFGDAKLTKVNTMYSELLHKLAAEVEKRTEILKLGCRH